jgi:hypothetical protein
MANPNLNSSCVAQSIAFKLPLKVVFSFGNGSQAIDIVQA